MLNDWVKIKEPNKYAGAIGTIQSLSSLEGAYLAIYINDPNFGTFVTDVFCEDIEPIPLTAEILEKNGIKWLTSCKRTYRCNEPPISCTFIPDRGWYLSAGPVGSSKLPFAVFSMAYYVHELQHAMRLCGVDKEITL